METFQSKQLDGYDASVVIEQALSRVDKARVAGIKRGRSTVSVAAWKVQKHEEEQLAWRGEENGGGHRLLGGEEDGGGDGGSRLWNMFQYMTDMSSSNQSGGKQKVGRYSESIRPPHF